MLVECLSGTGSACPGGRNGSEGKKKAAWSDHAAFWSDWDYFDAAGADASGVEAAGAAAAGAVSDAAGVDAAGAAGSDAAGAAAAVSAGAEAWAEASEDGRPCPASPCMSTLSPPFMITNNASSAKAMKPTKTFHIVCLRNKKS